MLPLRQIKHYNLVEFNKSTECMDIMDTSAIPKKRGGKRTKMTKSEPKVEVWKEYGCTYRTEHLNFSRAEHDSESDSNLILAQASKG